MRYVGITTSLVEGKSPERISLNAAYVQAVQGAGAMPVLLPPYLTGPQLDELCENLDGLVLTGGGDVDPARYDERPHPKVLGVSARRDRFEFIVLRKALEEHIPVLAICRGMQVLNVALGGTLFQHVPDIFGQSICHQQVEAGGQRSDVTHPVEVRRGTLLANLIGSGAVGVNSMHHQAVHALGQHMVPVARTADGLIEAIEAPSLGEFVLGVQWHPEELVEVSEAARALFDGFVAACGSVRVSTAG
ncbi:MAG: gamma-glutamyl-gamma-aminobutyrate hydrolase family protein [Dehalococcoidia bacterium]